MQWSPGVAPPGEMRGISPPEIAELPIFLTGIKFFKWKMGPFEKIVDEIRGVFNFGGSFGVPRLGPDPRPKIRGDAPAPRIKSGFSNCEGSFYCKRSRAQLGSFGSRAPSPSLIQ